MLERWVQSLCNRPPCEEVLQRFRQSRLGISQPWQSLWRTPENCNDGFDFFNNNKVKFEWYYYQKDFMNYNLPSALKDLFCIFWPAVGGYTLQTLVKICFFHRFLQDLNAKIIKIRWKLAYFFNIPKSWSTQKHWSSTLQNWWKHTISCVVFSLLF